MPSLFDEISSQFILDENGTTSFLATIFGSHKDEEANFINQRLIQPFFESLTALDGFPKDSLPQNVRLFPGLPGGSADMSFRMDGCLVVIENKVTRRSMRKGQLRQIWKGIKDKAKNEQPGYLIFLVPRSGMGQNEIARLPEDAKGRVQPASWEDLLTTWKSIVHDARNTSDHAWLSWLESGLAACERVLRPDPGDKSRRAVELKDAFTEIVERVVEVASPFAWDPDNPLIMRTSGGMEHDEERFAYFKKNPGRGVFVHLSHDSVTSDDKWILTGKQFFSVNKNARQLLGDEYEILWKMWEHVKRRSQSSRAGVFPLLSELDFQERTASKEFRFECSRKEAIEHVTDLTVEMIDQFREIMLFEQIDI